MEDIVTRVKRILQAKGLPEHAIENAISKMETTCVSCKYAQDCYKKGIILDPSHPKCDRHEYVEQFKSN